jgi:hypothetical protein
MLSLIVFLGVVVGCLIGYLAEEELKPGRWILDAFRHALFVIIIIVFFFNNISWMIFLLVSGMIILVSFHPKRETLYYLALAVVLFLSYRYNAFSLIAPLIFLYGLPVGSLYLVENRKKKGIKLISSLIISYFGFLALAIILGVLGAVL